MLVDYLVIGYVVNGVIVGGLMLEVIEKSFLCMICEDLDVMVIYLLLVSLVEVVLVFVIVLVVVVFVLILVQGDDMFQVLVVMSVGVCVYMNNCVFCYNIGGQGFNGLLFLQQYLLLCQFNVDNVVMVIFEGVLLEYG